AVARLQPEDLSHIRPGLDGFFSRWWDDQRRLWGNEAPLREPVLQTLLNIFASDIGPLRQDDVLHVAPQEAKLNLWTLEEGLRPFRQLIVGDGFSQGSAFSHPRLALYFNDKLLRAGQARQVEMRFVIWREETVKK